MAWRLFLDANVMFTAAHRPQGKAAFLFEWRDRWTLVSSAYALEECRRNLASKFPDALDRLKVLAGCIEWAPQLGGMPILEGLAEKDQPIYQAAVSARCTHLLTGDLRDFGSFMNQAERSGGIVIQTVAEFLAGHAPVR